jgi:hypothetical protein
MQTQTQEALEGNINSNKKRTIKITQEAILIPEMKISRAGMNSNIKTMRM